MGPPCLPARVKGPVGPFAISRPPCPGTILADGSCSEADGDEAFIRENTSGHHVARTCSIGAKSDKNAVQDSKFRGWVFYLW